MNKYFVTKKEELDRFLKIKDYQCRHKCIYICTEFQKKSCLDYYWMLAISEDPIEEILK